MGHKRQADDAPGPMQILAILGAREHGLSLRAIEKRTQVSKNTIARWCEKWRDDLIVCEDSPTYRELVAMPTFDALYPERDDAVQPSLKLVTPS